MGVTALFIQVCRRGLNSRSLASPLRALLFHITDCHQYRLDAPLKNACTCHRVGPAKSASIWAPHFLRSALLLTQSPFRGFSATKTNEWDVQNMKIVCSAASRKRRLNSEVLFWNTGRLSHENCLWRKKIIRRHKL